MSRTHPLRVLCVRPDDAAALPSLFGFSISRERGGVLPIALLELATAVLLGSRHRVFVHDARVAPGGNRAVRSVAAVHRADVAVIQLHPALLADGLEAARAARQGGCSLVLGAGPLVALWPAAARGAPELDGLIAPGAGAGLLAALDKASAGAPATEFAEALADASPLHASARGTDRKLLDYAAYRALPGEAAAPGVRVDKGRRAATPVALHEPFGALRSIADLRAELDACGLLGIPRRAFVPAPGRPLPDAATWLSLLEARTDGGRYRLPVGLGLDDAGLGHLLRAGTHTLDLGVVGAEASSIEELGARARSWRAAGVRVAAALVFGMHPLDVEERGLTAARAADIDFTVQVGVPLPPHADAAASWEAWLGAPRADFHPPVRDGARRIELAERARVLLGARPRTTGFTALWDRIARPR